MRAMRNATHLIVLCLAASLLGTAAGADGRARVFGIWASAKGTIISISQNGEALQGEVIAMRKPRPDRKNRDPQLRERPVIGLQLLSDYRFKHGGWRGKLYDPASGRTFSSYLKLDDDGNLRLRGYVGFALFGKTETFQPVGVCSERIVDALRLAGIEHLCV